MPNDAKIGLVLGVGFVIAAAVLSLNPAGGPVRPPFGSASATVGSVGAAGRERPARTPATPTSLTASVGRRHVVQEGDSLAGLAERYLGRADRLADILRANREAVADPDRLTPGTVLVIPDAADQ